MAHMRAEAQCQIVTVYFCKPRGDRFKPIPQADAHIGIGALTHHVVGNAYALSMVHCSRPHFKSQQSNTKPGRSAVFKAPCSGFGLYRGFPHYSSSLNIAVSSLSSTPPGSVNPARLQVHLLLNSI